MYTENHHGKSSSMAILCALLAWEHHLYFVEQGNRGEDSWTEVIQRRCYQLVTVRKDMRIPQKVKEIITRNRKMKGEELQGLNVDELQELEQLLHASLGRVSKTKVCLSFLWSLMSAGIYNIWALKFSIHFLHSTDNKILCFRMKYL